MLPSYASSATTGASAACTAEVGGAAACASNFDRQRRQKVRRFPDPSSPAARVAVGRFPHFPAIVVVDNGARGDTHVEDPGGEIAVGGCEVARVFGQQAPVPVNDLVTSVLLVGRLGMPHHIE